jgi:hypothetical protein
MKEALYPLPYFYKERKNDKGYLLHPKNDEIQEDLLTSFLKRGQLS